MLLSLTTRYLVYRITFQLISIKISRCTIIAVSQMQVRKVTLKAHLGEPEGGSPSSAVRTRREAHGCCCGRLDLCSCGGKLPLWWSSAVQGVPSPSSVAPAVCVSKHPSSTCLVETASCLPVEETLWSLYS